MTERPIWDSQTWRIIIAVSIILTIIASILSVLDYLGKIDLRTPLQIFFKIEVPIYIILIAIIIIIIIYLVFARIVKREGNILDYENARKIALLCQQPRTTTFLEQQYNYWQRQSRGVVLGGYGFNDYIKRLEKQGYLKYNEQNGTWQVTQKALDYIIKYHGS